jgi:hypothetical protein
VINECSFDLSETLKRVVATSHWGKGGFVSADPQVLPYGYEFVQFAANKICLGTPALPNQPIGA